MKRYHSINAGSVVATADDQLLAPVETEPSEAPFSTAIHLLHESDMPLAVSDFPAGMRRYARRNERLSGRGTPDCPYIGGWIVDREAAAYDSVAKDWLKSHGFAFRGRSWYRFDQI